MRPLATLKAEEARAIEVLLFDLDDTLLSHGVLTRAAYDALWSMHDAGLALVAVTGRPAGWGEVVARQWPLLGVVAENGAALMWLDPKRGLVRSLRGSIASRALDRARLDAIVADVRDEVPGVELADDNGARLTDVTFDIGERVRLGEAAIQAARARIHAAGARSIRSSVHLHATFEGDDKASGALRMLAERRALDPCVARLRAAFIGDSENDAACFSCFRTTFGVANVARWTARLSLPPHYVAPSEMGAGFAEVASAPVAARA